MERLRHWHLPDGIDCHAVGNVVVRGRFTNLRGEPEPTRDGIRKGIARDGRGTAVHRFTVSVSGSELEAVAHPLLDVYRKSLVGRIGPVSHKPDAPEVRIDSQIFLGGVIRPEAPR